MKIIDAHLHFFPDEERFRQTAAAAGHEASLSHLQEVWQQNHIVWGIGMGTTPGGEEFENPLMLPFPRSAWPAKFSQCLGIRAETITTANAARVRESFAAALQREEVVGIKVYAGYQPFYVNDPVYWPFYELAEAHRVPVVVHTGDTATSTALLKYSHPLTIDEVAVNFPRVDFVMAHYGNPWIVDATEVLAKNPNVYADLSGLAEGLFVAEDFAGKHKPYLDLLRLWQGYLSRYDKLMFGSDWPLVNVPAYIALLRQVIPEEHQEAVFYANARRIFAKLPAV